MSAVERKFERITKLLETLTQLSERGDTIVVEGIRDLECLRELGIHGEVICTQSNGNGFGDLVEQLSTRPEVIILTDFDDEGEILAARLSQELTRLRVRVNHSIWRQLKDLARGDIRSIEEMRGLLERLRVRVYGPRAAL
jgi:5S rRNA maturation endonuclease (ribonuclease M5)